MNKKVLIDYKYNWLYNSGIDVKLCFKPIQQNSIKKSFISPLCLSTKCLRVTTLEIHYDVGLFIAKWLTGLINKFKNESNNITETCDKIKSKY